MEKPETYAQLEEAMLTVRQSYRMLFDFHKRVQSIIDVIIDNIDGYQFACWIPSVSKANSSTNPHYPNRWTWDAFPQHTYSVFTTETGSIKDPIKAGETLIEIRFASDESIFELFENQEPNPNRIPVGDAITSIRIIFWHCKSMSAGVRLHWLTDIWNEVDFSKAYSKPILLGIEGAELYQIPYTYLLEELIDKPAVIRAALDSFAEFEKVKTSL